MKRLTHVLILAAFILSCGGNWAVLQCVAWINMIHDYSQIVPLPQAVSMTFSGQYPCEMCKLISEKKTSDRDQAFHPEKLPQKFLSPSFRVPLRGPAVAFRYPTEASPFPTRAEVPPTPPPRRLAA